MPSNRWTCIGFCLLAVMLVAGAVATCDFRKHERLSAQTAMVLENGKKYQAMQPSPSQEEYLRILPHRLEFVKDGQVVYYLDWAGGVVSGSGQITPAARLLMEAIGEQVAEQCGGKR